MAHTYDLVLIHCVFSTKGRLPLIQEPGRLCATLRAVARRSQINLRAIGGTADHVHLLMDMPKTRTVADVMRELKANSSARLRKSTPGFAWQDGYAAISVSPTAAEAVTRYIQKQQEHHRRSSFEEEYVAILHKAGIEYDSKYVLD